MVLGDWVCPCGKRYEDEGVHQPLCPDCMAKHEVRERELLNEMGRLAGMGGILEEENAALRARLAEVSTRCVELADVCRLAGNFMAWKPGESDADMYALFDARDAFEDALAKLAANPNTAALIARRDAERAVVDELRVMRTWVEQLCTSMRPHVDSDSNAHVVWMDKPRALSALSFLRGMVGADRSSQDARIDALTATEKEGAR